MDRIKTDICVIGAGSAGLSVASGAVQMGARVVLLEGGKMGGDCLNFGCVPSKSLIAAGKAAHAMRSGGYLGISPVEPEIDYAKAMDHVASVIAKIAPHDSQERFESLGVRVIRAFGTFISETELKAGEHVVEARRFVIATGSSPLVPPIDGLKDVPYLTNETLFDNRERPEHLLVIGGGPIGMEMAQAHQRLGARVTVIEGDKALNRDDPEMAEIVLGKVKAEGVEIAEGALVEQISGKAGAITVHAKDGRKFEGSHLLVAVGRTPNLERLDLEAAGVSHDRKGVTVDADLRSSNRRIYAIGDAAGGLQFTHVAGYHAGVVMRAMLFGLPAKERTDHIPRVTYTDPELAQIGLTEAEAHNKHGQGLTVLRQAFEGNDRALAEGKSGGLIKIMVYGGRPVGVSIAGPQAGELIGLWSLALAKKLKLATLTGMVLPYPTLNEVSKRAAGNYFSPKLFDSPWVKRAVRMVQRVLP